MFFAVIAVPALSASPSVVNGDFEMPQLGDPPFSCHCAVPGWTRTGAAGDQDLVAVGDTGSDFSVTSAGHGKQFFTLGGGSAAPGNAALSTQITGLAPGTSYLLEFMLASERPDISQSVTISFSGGSSTPARTFVTVASSTPGWRIWESKQMMFVASATLVFSVVNLRENLGLDDVTIAAAPAVPSSPVWTQQLSQIQGSPSSPPVRDSAAMAYDAARGQVVLFGGYNGSSVLGDTWVWDGSNWSQRFPATNPSPRDDTAAIYDPMHNVVVLFGGYSGGGLNDTWIWDGINWTKASPSTSPPVRWAHRLAYDSTRNQVVLFGGYGGSDYLGDTWVWDGSNWTQKNPQNSPPKRERFAMAYDAASQQVVIFGGYGGANDDTWVWDGSNWTQKMPSTSPSQRGDVLMAYDSAHNETVLFGGTASNSPASDTWIWDGTNWTRQAPSNPNPPARSAQGMAFDDADGVIVMFGGAVSRTQLLNDTWTWNGGPLPPVLPAITTVISAGGFGGFSTVAPGTWVEIYGSNLSLDTRLWAGSDFNGNNAPTSLDGVQVTIGGQKAFVDYISSNPGQVNAQLPSNIPTGGSLPIVVTNGTASSAPFTVNVNTTAAGLLAPPAFQIGGKQYVVALLPDGATYILPPGTIAGVASHPAHPGEIITLYGIGFGDVEPSLPAGQIETQTNQLSLPLQILFGKTPGTLPYAGLAPGFVGLYQFNVKVPPVPDNDLVPLTFNLGGAAGPQTLYTSVRE
ncbi:MAG TPA: kelch repeat-containing protein [Bryobacteraceae bacterium]|nr:kelch repeat-containing protein [Bryobacteraceae bacterium]